jgi:hypothetical protein
MKKLLSLLMAALFALTLSVPTFAEDKPASGTKDAASAEAKKKSKKEKEKEKKAADAKKAEAAATAEKKK